MGALEAGPDKACEVSCNKSMSMDLISIRLSDSSIKNEPTTQPIPNPRRDLFPLGCVQISMRKVPLEIGSLTILVVESANLFHRFELLRTLFSHHRTNGIPNFLHRYPSTRNDQIWVSLAPRTEDFTEDGSTLLRVRFGLEVIRVCCKKLRFIEHANQGRW